MTLGKERVGSVGLSPIVYLTCYSCAVLFFVLDNFCEVYLVEYLLLLPVIILRLVV